MQKIQIILQLEMYLFYVKRKSQIPNLKGLKMLVMVLLCGYFVPSSLNVPVVKEQQ